jgi:hypothetical protein
MARNLADLNAYDWSTPVPTDVRGVAELKEVPSTGLSIRVAAEGYQAQVLDIWRAREEVRVVLAEAEGQVVVRLVDKRSGEPVTAPASFSHEGGPLVALRRDVGLYALQPGDLLWPQSPVQVVCEGYGRAGFLLEISAPQQVVTLDPTVSVQVSLSRDDVAARLLVETLEAPSMPANAPFARRLRQTEVRVMPAASAAVEVPLGARVAISAYAERGCFGRLEITTERGMAVTVPVEEIPSLRIIAYDGTGSQFVGGLQTRAYFPAGFIDCAPESDGSVRVPWIAEVRKLDIRQSDGSLVKLYRTAAEPSGELSLPWPKAVPVTIQATDEAGGPLPGIEISLVSNDPWPIRTYPRLHGNVPTEHPGWSRMPAATVFGIADERGEFRTRLATGPWEVVVRYAGSTPPAAPVFSEERSKILVGVEPQVYPIRMSASRAIEISIYDSMTKAPIKGITVLTSALAYSGEVIPAASATVVVPVSMSEIAVGAPGYDSKTIALHADRDDFGVGLERSVVASKLLLTGDAVGKLRGLAVTLRVTGNDLPDGPVLWQESFGVGANGEVDFNIPLAGKYTVFISDLDGWRFTPIQPLWTAGNVISFAAQRSGS